MRTARRSLAAPAVLVAAALIAAGATAAAPAAGCPAGDRDVRASTRAGAATRLVPPGASSVRLCRYRGLDPPSEADRLISGRLIVAATTTRMLADELDAIPVTTGVYSCPADLGSSVVAYFRYRSGPPDPVTIGLSGCELVSNGRVHRTGGVSPAGRTAIADVLAALRGTS